MHTGRDIVIVGGGPAGSATALAITHLAPDLASRVVILEKAHYPRDKPCAGALGARGDALLAQVGVAIDVPSVRIDGISLRGATKEACAAPGRIGRVVRRIEFDDALARAVMARGVVVRQGVRVLRVGPPDADGAVLETTAGDVRARVVVGCDGVASVVRKGLGLDAGRLRAQVIEVDTPPVPADRDRTLLHVDVSDPGLLGYAWDFPTIVNGRNLVCRGVYRLKAPRSRSQPDIAALLHARLRTMGVDPARCENKRYAERGYEGAPRLSNGAVMLVGEAAGIDVATGEGIAQSIEYGALAGRYIVGRIRQAGSGRLSVDGWHDEIAASRLSRDLRIRARLMHLFCGPARPGMDWLLTRSPDMLHVGCQHFAAQSLDWVKLAKVAVRGALASGRPASWR
jgi:menaquinone-9 beta-reductase